MFKASVLIQFINICAGYYPQPNSYNFNCPSSGFFPAFKDCSLYHQCVFAGMPPLSTFKCPYGEYFQPGQQKCIKSNEADCKMENSATTDNCVEGLSPDPSDYEWYFNCSAGVLVRQRCLPERYIYSDAVKQCVNPYTPWFFSASDQNFQTESSYVSTQDSNGINDVQNSSKSEAQSQQQFILYESNNSPIPSNPRDDPKQSSETDSSLSPIVANDSVPRAKDSSSSSPTETESSDSEGKSDNNSASAKSSNAGSANGKDYSLRKLSAASMMSYASSFSSSSLKSFSSRNSSFSNSTKGENEQNAYSESKSSDFGSESSSANASSASANSSTFLSEEVSDLPKTKSSNTARLISQSPSTNEPIKYGYPTTTIPKTTPPPPLKTTILEPVNVEPTGTTKSQTPSKSSESKSESEIRENKELNSSSKVDNESRSESSSFSEKNESTSSFTEQHEINKKEYSNSDS